MKIKAWHGGNIKGQPRGPFFATLDRAYAMVYAQFRSLYRLEIEVDDLFRVRKPSEFCLFPEQAWCVLPVARVVRSTEYKMQLWRLVWKEYIELSKPIMWREYWARCIYIPKNYNAKITILGEEKLGPTHFRCIGELRESIRMAKAEDKWFGRLINKNKIVLFSPDRPRKIYRVNYWDEIREDEFPFYNKEPRET